MTFVINKKDIAITIRIITIRIKTIKERVVYERVNSLSADV